jgi:hypothetical protein
MPKVSKEATYILRKLYTWKRVGNKYMNIHDVIRVFPRHLRNKRLLKEWVKELLKEDLVLIHKNGECISLNKHRLGEIESIIFAE